MSKRYFYYTNEFVDIQSRYFLYFQKKENSMYDSVIKITTEDAYTLTDGPTIFITENVYKLALVYLKATNIPADELDKKDTIITEPAREEDLPF